MTASRWEMAAFPFLLPSWLWAVPLGDGNVKVIENLIGLFDLGHAIGPFQTIIENPQFYNLPPRGLAPYHLNIHAGMARTMAEHIANDDVLPFGQAKESAITLRNIIDEIWSSRSQTNSLMEPFTPAEVERLRAAIVQLIYNLRHELNEMPVFLVTERGAYDVRTLLVAAEKIFNQDQIPLFSDHTLFDIREAGICMAFNVPTAAGFHSVRAVEAVARAYHEIIIRVRPGTETPLGPLANNLRTERDRLAAAKKIEKEDLLHLVIEFLARINNIYRKPITHPDMILDLPTAMTVFDAAKCAISLMLEDGSKRYSPPPIPKGFF